MSWLHEAEPGYGLTVSIRRTSNHAWIRPAVSATVLLAALIATAAAVFGMWIDTYGSAETRCFLDSTFPGTVTSVDVTVDAAYATGFPAGRYCLWAEYDGTITVEQTGWIPTWIALGFLVLAIVAFFALIGTEWVTPGALLLVLILGGWVTIWVMSDTFLSPVLWPDPPPIQSLPVGG